MSTFLLELSVQTLGNPRTTNPFQKRFNLRQHTTTNPFQKQSNLRERTTAKHSYVDREILTDWLKDTLLRELKRRRVVHGCSCPEFLLLDNCSAPFRLEAQGIVDRYGRSEEMGTCSGWCQLPQHGICGPRTSPKVYHMQFLAHEQAKCEIAT
jgi:hypothetical protein